MNRRGILPQRDCALFLDLLRGAFMRIAVASMEGAYINHGLPAAEQFFVFDVSLSGITFVEKRENRYRTASVAKGLGGIGELLRDCKVICCTQAGADAVEFFGRRGVEMEMSEGPIDEKLRGFIESVF
jgi:predicted Fe-Mo cluster-binding NifX family protein